MAAPAQGWYRIVRTPEEAREVIAADKLAVVLGTSQVDHLFNCRNEGDLTADDVRIQLDKYYDLGVRPPFPDPLRRQWIWWNRVSEPHRGNGRFEPSTALSRFTQLGGDRRRVRLWGYRGPRLGLRNTKGLTPRPGGRSSSAR